jgi:hypothetical protein
MRLGVAASVIGHGTILAVALMVLAHPRLVDSAPTPAINVDLVPQDELPPWNPTEKDAGEAVKEPPSAPSPSSAAADPGPRPAGSDPSPPSAASLPSPRPAPAPDMAPGRIAGIGSEPSPDPFTSEAGAPPLFVPYLQGLDSTGSEDGVDAPTDKNAKLSGGEVAAFRTHLQRCWKLPPDVTHPDKLHAVLRIALDPRGALVREPLLVSASASADGPKLVQAAMRALRHCQPFSFLPADRYDEWKLLDLSFSPHGLAGG